MKKRKKENNLKLKRFFDTATDRFINRELSWLEFNIRVLEEAKNERNPVLERIKFLSISSSNMDEFYMVRVAGLMDQIRNKYTKVSIDGMQPHQQLENISKRTIEVIKNQQELWSHLKEELRKDNIYILSKEDLSKEDKTWLKNYFNENIFPVLSPIAIDPSHPFPFIPNLGMAVILEVIQKAAKNKKINAIIPVPNVIDRFIKLGGNRARYMLLEEVIELFVDTLFSGDHVSDFGLFRVIRDSDLEIEDEAEDLVSHFETAVKKRKRGTVISLRISSHMSESLEHLVTKELGVDQKDTIKMSDMTSLDQIIELTEIDRPDLKFTPYEERFPERINDFGGDCFAAIAEKDIIIHHPYETFDVVVNLVQQAARDPNVVAIKQTLYRTSSNSSIVKALIEAAEAGKSVTCVVELKARFDEEANIRWARDLERAGAQVVFGFVKLKTHAKMSLIIRREEEHMRYYAHFGTGNYHPITARVYSDLSFFTCNKDICNDTAHLFNYLTGYSPSQDYKKIFYSPLTLREEIKQLINDEINFAKLGKPANIWIKLNAITDPEIIDMLYKASQAGVKINMIVRGVCGLRPGIEGFSENIIVKSIVGRFLEHARIVCFGAGHKLPSKNAKVFISSADWMPRNFDQRVEVMIPIDNSTVHEQVMGQIMLANLKDTKQSWILNSDGKYTRVKSSKKSMSAHEYFMTNPSLSGRGKALTAAQSEEQRKKIHQLFSYQKKGK